MVIETETCTYPDIAEIAISDFNSQVLLITILNQFYILSYYKIHFKCGTFKITQYCLIRSKQARSIDGAVDLNRGNNYF